MALHAYILERGDPAALLHLATRLLTDAALGHRARVLLRMQAAGWLRNAGEWPAPDEATAIWLAAQEYPDLATFWADALRAADVETSVCAGSQQLFAPTAPATAARPDSLVGFLADAERDGALVHWIA